MACFWFCNRDEILSGEYFVFAFLRDPVSRFISAYNFLHGARHFRHKEKLDPDSIYVVDPILAFQKFIERVELENGEMLCGGLTWEPEPQA